MRKRILSALLAVMFLFTGLPGTAWAVGEGNMEAGGGQTETVTGDSFWNGDWGIRFCVVDVASQTVVSATYDAANKSSGYENYKHYGKTNKFDYRNGAPLNGQIGTYGWNTPPVTIPTIVRTSGTPDIKAIKDYFTDETVIRWIGDVTGMAYDTLISGDYKLFIEPILYYTFDSQKYAMTATEAALFDRAINGLLLRTMGNATHQQLPLSLYLEKSDLGFSKWSGAKTGIQNDTNIINYLGMGIVSFIPEEDPEPGTGGNGDGPTVPISFRKTDPERFNAANYNTGLITFAPASSNSAAFDNISGAVIEISGNGTGAGTYELPCTVELGEGTFTVTPKEKARLQRRANEAKMPLSRYLLEMGLTGKIVNYDYLLKCFLQMRRIGNNINQAVRIMNTFHSDCEGEFEYVLREMNRLQDVLDRYIERELKENKHGVFEGAAGGDKHPPEQSD